MVLQAYSHLTVIGVSSFGSFLLWETVYLHAYSSFSLSLRRRKKEKTGAALCGPGESALPAVKRVRRRLGLMKMGLNGLLGRFGTYRRGAVSMPAASAHPIFKVIWSENPYKRPALPVYRV